MSQITSNSPHTGATLGGYGRQQIPGISESTPSTDPLSHPTLNAEVTLWFAVGDLSKLLKTLRPRLGRDLGWFAVCLWMEFSE